MSGSLTGFPHTSGSLFASAAPLFHQKGGWAERPACDLVAVCWSGRNLQLTCLLTTGSGVRAIRGAAWRDFMRLARRLGLLHQDLMVSRQSKVVVARTGDPVAVRDLRQFVIL